MEKLSFPIFIAILFSSLSSCDKKVMDYNSVYSAKANEIILQTVKNSACDCMLEISNQSLLEVSEAENPQFKAEKFILQNLNLRDRSSLDSLSNISKNFKLDLELLKKNNIKIVTSEELKKVIIKNDLNLLKKCPKGIISVERPVFDKDFKKAVFNYGFAFTCIGHPIRLYEIKNNRWERVKNETQYRDLTVR